MRLAYMVLSALLVSSVMGEPALAAAAGTQKSEQEKKRPQTVRRAAPKPENKNGGFAIHPPTHKSGRSEDWLRGNQQRRGWSF